MARFLIATMPFVSHINPSLSMVRALVEHGHEVWWYTGAKFQRRVEATGAHYTPMQSALDFDEDHADDLFPERAGLKSVARFKWDIKHVFMDPGPAQLRDLRAILQQFPADVVVSESIFTGAHFLAELGGPPWAVFNFLPLTLPSRDTAPFGLGLPPSSSTLGRLRNRGLGWLFSQVLFRDVMMHHNLVRREVGLPAQEIGVSRFLYMQGTTPAFEYPRSDLPPQVHFVGPFLPERPTEFQPPPWWDELKGDRPVVLVTQGTVSTDSQHLILPTLQALADEDVLVIATTGTKTNGTLDPADIPTNARVAPFLSYYHLMPHVRAMITNGGYGSVQLALAHGIPLVVAGKTEEKAEIAARIAWSGVGINLNTNLPMPTPTQLREATRAVLNNPPYRQRAQVIQQEFARYDASSNVVRLLEQLAKTKQPVLRQDG